MTDKNFQIDIDDSAPKSIPGWVNGKARVEGFFMGYQKAFMEVSRDRDLGVLQLRVWLYFLAVMDFENWVILPQKEIAAALSTQPADICRTIKLLVNKGLLVAGPRIGRVTAYRINKNFAWKGKKENRLKLLSADS